MRTRLCNLIYVLNIKANQKGLSRCNQVGSGMMNNHVGYPLTPPYLLPVLAVHQLVMRFLVLLKHIRKSYSFQTSVGQGD